jgi:hypothetical protein
MVCYGNSNFVMNFVNERLFLIHWDGINYTLDSLNSIKIEII